KLRPPWGEALTSSGDEPPPSTGPYHGLRLRAHVHLLGLILHDNKVMVTQDKINALIKALALANVNIGSLICSVGAGGPAPAADPAPSTTAAAAEEKKVEAKKEESEESDDDMGFGLFD
ncbi:hypothetical protein EI555_000764, partial [Monodon monoceros]